MTPGWEFMPWYGMIFGPIMMIVVLAAIGAIIVLIVRWAGGSMAPGGVTYHPPQLLQKSALDILDERFAKGEIEKDEFEEKKRLLHPRQ